MMTDNVNHPSHYTDNKFLGHECIDFAGLMPFRLGNAFKYVWRAEYKGHFEEDLDKAVFYLKNYQSNQAIPIMEISAFNLEKLNCILWKFKDEKEKYEEDNADPGLRFKILMDIVNLSGCDSVEVFTGINDTIALINKYKNNKKNNNGNRSC